MIGRQLFLTANKQKQKIAANLVGSDLTGIPENLGLMQFIIETSANHNLGENALILPTTVIKDLIFYPPASC